MANAISRTDAPHYVWGVVSHGWRLVDTPELSVIEEEVPAGASEDWHEHRIAQQFFYVLEGAAVMRKDSGDVHLEAGEGVTVSPGERHRFTNPFNAPVRFIVTSAPNTRGDRYEVPPPK